MATKQSRVRGAGPAALDCFASLAMTVAENSAMSFQGFGPEALPFFKALKFHQSREWLEANRATYESAVRGPMGDLVEDVAARLGKAKIPINGDRKSSVFRIHRDVRFSS